MAIKICNIVGARPQFIKYCAMHRQIKAGNRKSSSPVEEFLIHTGQHYDYTMSDIFFKELDFKQPDFQLGVGSAPHGRQTAAIMEKTEAILLDLKPELVLVYGDTNSTLAAALAAAKLHIPVAHVEAGLRSFNKAMPEEINRVLTDHVSTLLFCPSRTAVENLQQEHFTTIVNSGKLSSVVDIRASSAPMDPDHPCVVNVGDIMYDVMLAAAKTAEKESHILGQLNLRAQDYCLMTIHRAENTDSTQSFHKIIDFVADATSGKTTIFPAHPRTQSFIREHAIHLPENITLIDPLGYLDLLKLLKHSSLLLTDSGGMQKEAYWSQVPCITLREETEWLETIETGWNTLYQNHVQKRQPKAHQDIYGDGRAAEKILNILHYFLQQKSSLIV